MGINPFDLLRLSAATLLGSPLRSGLSVLGTFMGVAAVSATLQVGDISRAVIDRQLRQQDAPQIGFGLWRSEFYLEDVTYLSNRLPEAAAVAAWNWTWNFFRPARFRDRNAEDPTVHAATADYFQVRGRRRLAGRLFLPEDFSGFRSVVVVDQVLADLLFEGADPVGETIQLGNEPFAVVGVVQPEASGERDNGLAVVPFSTYSAITGDRQIRWLSVRPRRLDDIDALGDRAKRLLERQRPGSDIFGPRVSIEEILERRNTFRLVSRSLAALGAIALVVGGIGIANITVASVMERTREIGLRRAIGATRLEILLQFILEAVWVSAVGGAAAIVAVHGLALGVAERFDLPYQFQRRTAALSLGSALVVGVAAGLLPALQASRLDPVAALRSR